MSGMVDFWASGMGASVDVRLLFDGGIT
jgi:hypothetical protein